MANINLLPWRDQYRQEKKQEFITILVGVCAAAAFIAYLWISSIQGSIANQTSRNSLLQTEISALEKQVVEIKELKKRRSELLDRMKVIQDLQGTRPVIVRYFDELARSVPDGVYLTLLVRKGSVINIEGIAESNNRVSSMMRNLDQSEWFSSPNLTSVSSASKEEGEQANKFKMTVVTSAPKESDKEDN